MGDDFVLVEKSEGVEHISVHSFTSHGLRLLDLATVHLPSTR